MRLSRSSSRPGVRALPGLRQVQGHLRLREVAPEGPGARPADRREVPALRLADGHQDRPVRRVPGLHHVSRRARAPAPSRSGIKCPKCLEGDLAERRTKRGKSFWGCVRYPACDFSTWNKPVPETCPECGWVGMEKKINKARGRDPHLPEVRPQDRARRARGGGAGVNATVVGGGLAGSEAAWALAERGVQVTLYEMRPAVKTPAHRTDRLAELVCSNSFKSIDLTNAHGLLKAELRALGSLLLPCADRARVPGGTALAVDRERVLPGGARPRDARIPNITRGARGSGRAAVARRRGDRSAHLATASPRRSSRGSARRARVLRCHRAGRLVATRSTTSGSTRSPATARAGRRLPQCADGRAGLRGVPRRADRGRPAPRATTSTRCRTSRAACRSRRWRGAAGRRSASAR